ncbi:peptidoglycan-recognition protein LC-like isoform X7 [Drosophila innubila]|uniref:peptidoglycan-recognition protein LC-like isoform X7 n=1 Tax=Drosophila innubila TaxID=198719 RepID=UPI00148C6370|nr:peptidoglycan-recognition protein LC-like isoform X7 [Drosophila innubila]
MSSYAFQYCLKCGDFIKKSTLKCDGICGRVCHAHCSALTVKQLEFVQIMPNISWRCDNCLEQRQNEQQLSLKLEKWLKQYEKRLEVLEQGFNRSTKSNESCEAPALCPFLPHNISRKAIIITAIFVALTIVLGIILATTTNLFGKTLNKNKDNIGGGLVLRFVPRPVWLAQPPQKQLPDLSLPVPIVILLPTNSENCSTQAQCVFRVRFLQTFNIESEHHDDIKFNFLIGGDGNVYVGRGWDIVGAHMHGYNTRSVSFAYIGTFQKQKPSSKQLNVTRLLLEDGVNLGKIAPDYKLIGASSLEPTITEYNAEQLYESFANWTHWTKVN